jgi:hypothetical protein
VITGTGKVGGGIKEILDAMKIKEVSVENYLTKNYAQPVYTQIDVLDYNKRIDGKVLDCSDFYKTQRIILVILTIYKSIRYCNYRTFSW